MPLPENFKWIDTIGELPKMVTEGIKLLGIKEIPGAHSNPEILKFADEIGVRDIYKNDDTSWCAVAHYAVCLRAGKAIDIGKKDKYDKLRAKSFAQLGSSVNADTWRVIDRKEAMLGDTLVFVRPGGYHVGMYIGESPTHFIVMGGNQSNMYSITRIAKERLFAVRRPKYNAMPVSVKKYFLSNAGTPVTTNEA